MLVADTTRTRIRTIVSQFRVAVLATIAFLALLMVVVACVVAIWDVSDRAMNIVSIVLTALPTMVTALIVYLKIDGVGEEVKSGNAEASAIAAMAARNAETAAIKTAAVHHDLLNGGLRENVKRAIQEIEADPEMRARRIENIARGISKDRHDTRRRQGEQTT